MQKPTSRRALLLHLLVGLAPALALQACSGGGGGNEVVVYCSLDQVYSEPLLKQFEEATGIKVRAQYDVEAQKTTGLVNRILAEKSNPQCDVYWNNELMHTLHLASVGALQPYASPSAAPIPAEFKDASGLWTGFAARARVLLVNTDKVPAGSAPKSLRDLMKPEWNGKFGIARPLFGTTMTHASALFAAWGDEDAKKFFRELKANEAVVCEGNAAVMRVVAAGDVPCGLTDTDDANVAVKEGKKVAVVYLDQEEGGLGTLVIPNSIMLLAGAPHAENGKKLIDWALSPKVEEALAAGTSVQMPLNPSVKTPEGVRSIANVKPMKVDWAAAAAKRDEVSKFLAEIFLAD